MRTTQHDPSTCPFGQTTAHYSTRGDLLVPSSQPHRHPGKPRFCFPRPWAAVHPNLEITPSHHEPQLRPVFLPFQVTARYGNFRVRPTHNIRPTTLTPDTRLPSASGPPTTHTCVPARLFHLSGPLAVTRTCSDVARLSNAVKVWTHLSKQDCFQAVVPDTCIDQAALSPHRRCPAHLGPAISSPPAYDGCTSVLVVWPAFKRPPVWSSSWRPPSLALFTHAEA